MDCECPLLAGGGKKGMGECDAYFRAAVCLAMRLDWVTRLLVVLLVGYHCRSHSGLVACCQIEAASLVVLVAHTHPRPHRGPGDASKPSLCPCLGHLSQLWAVRRP